MNYSLNTTTQRTVEWKPVLEFTLKSIFMPTPELTVNICIITIGVLLNFLLLVIVLASRQLHYPRHMFWVIIALINQFCFLHRIAKIVGIIYKTSWVRQFYVLNAGVGYSLLLLCLSLAAFDRYLAIAYSEWYKEKFNNRILIALVVGTCFLTYMGITSPFWLGYKKITNFSVNMQHIHWVLVWDLLLGIGCVCLHIKIFTKSKSLIRLYPHHFNRPQITVQFSSISHRGHESKDVQNGIEVQEVPGSGPLQAAHHQRIAINVEQSNVDVTNDQMQNDKTTSTGLFNSDDADCFPWFRPQINRLEVKAALNLSVNTIPFWICTFPITGFGISIYWALVYRLDCSMLLTINFYMDFMFLFHLVYNPVMYMCRSLEFRRAFKRFCQKWSPITCKVIPND